MNTNHAKAIKGMSIANIVLAALGIFGMLIAWAGLGVGGAAVSGSGYDYFYTDSGYYFTTDDVSALFGMLGFLVFFVLICAALILVAGILGVRGAAKPEKLRGVMIWNIVAAVASLISGCWVSLVLCIIVAVFANKDRTQYAAPAPAAPYGYAPTAAPTAPVVPQQPAPVASVAPQQPVAAPAAPVAAQQPAAAPVATAPVAAEPVAVTATEAIETTAEPAIILPDNYIEDAQAGVAVIEETPSDASTADVAADDDKPTA